MLRPHPMGQRRKPEDRAAWVLRPGTRQGESSPRAWLHLPTWSRGWGGLGVGPRIPGEGGQGS